MNPEKELPENPFNNSEYGSPDVEDFLKELEAKEKDLEISSDLVVEIGENDISEADELELLRFLEGLEEKNQASRKAVAPVTDYQPFNEKVLKTDGEIAELQQKISKLEAERAEMSETVRRHKTDLENYRKRMERERTEVLSGVLSSLASQLLPVIDNLGRALETSVPNENWKEFVQFQDGIGMISQQLYDGLADMGIEPIKSVGEPFDPNLHEAVAAEQTNKFPPHTVIAELLRGFRIGDKIIRHSLVKVSTTANSEAALDKSATNNHQEF